VAVIVAKHAVRMISEDVVAHGWSLCHADA
jgi:hypothetical protein